MGPSYLESHQGFTLVVLIRRHTARLAPDDTELHMFDLEPDEQEIDAPDNNVLEMVLALAVFELDVQTVFDTNIHLDHAVRLRRHPVAVNPEILLTDHVGHAPAHRDTDEVAQAYIDAGIRLVLLLDILEQEGECVGVLQLAWRRKLGLEGEKLVMYASVVEHLDCADELHLDASVFQALSVFRSDCHGAFDRFTIHV